MRRGFTLMEILLVLAILIAVVGIAAPSMQRTMEHQALKDTAVQLRARCGSARVTAMKTGQIQMLRVELGGSKYYLQPWSQGDEALNASEAEAFNATQTNLAPAAITEKQLPAGITFASLHTPFDTRGATVEDTLLQFERGTSKFSQPVLFYPDGTSSASTMILANARELAVEIKLRSLTGVCHVGDVTTLSSLQEQP
jgi:Tfp pilus assembly protein FimT